MIFVTDAKDIQFLEAEASKYIKGIVDGTYKKMSVEINSLGLTCFYNSLTIRGAFAVATVTKKQGNFIVHSHSSMFPVLSSLVPAVQKAVALHAPTATVIFEP